MTSILSRLLTADKPWTAPYSVPVQRYPLVGQVLAQQQINVVSGNEFPSVQVPAGRRRKNSRKAQDAPVRFGRVPKREKAKILAAMQKVNACSQEKALEAALEDELRLLTMIVRAHEETCEFTKDKVANLVEKARSQPYPSGPITCPLNPAPHLLENGNMENFSQRFAPAIQGVVEFAKRCPAFGFLSQEDQVTLLRASVFEVLLVRLACMFDSQAKTLVALNGQILRRDAFTTANNARFLMDSLFEFAERLNAIHLSDSEVGLFCAVIVITIDRPGLRNIDLVSKIQKKLTDILRKAVTANHPENPSAFDQLMNTIPDLRTLNALHSEKLQHKEVEQQQQQPHHFAQHDLWSQYVSPQEDILRSSPHSSHGSEWSTTESSCKEDNVGSPRSMVSCSHYNMEDVKSPVRSSRSAYVHEEVAWPVEHTVVEYHHKMVAENGSSSGDEGYFVDSPTKGSSYSNRVDSPTDSGIDSGKEHGTSPTLSLCSSPHSSSGSSVDEKLKESIEDMPVLKRALQAPPIVTPHMLMDEAYRHHKKFRAARRESPAGQMSLASTHSTLVRTLEQAPRYLSEQQLKRTDLIHNIIMQKETLPQQPPQPPSHHQDGSQYVFSSSSSPNSTYTNKSVLVSQNGYYNSNQYAAAPVSWPFPQSSPSPPVPQQQVHYEQHLNSPSSRQTFCPSPVSRAGSPRYNPQSPLVMDNNTRQHKDSQPLNLSKKLFNAPLLKMES